MNRIADKKSHHFTRYLLNPKKSLACFSESRIHTIVPLNSLTGSPPNSSVEHPFRNPTNLNPVFGLNPCEKCGIFTVNASASLDPKIASRWFSSSAENRINNSRWSSKNGVEIIDMTPQQVSLVIEAVKAGKEDDLHLDGATLSVASVCEIFQVLNIQKVPALRFFRWVRRMAPGLYKCGDVCSLMIDNCGRLDDYEMMVSLLKEFKSERICLTNKAFGFLPVLDSSEANVKESAKKMVDILQGVRGSCRGSGIGAMINMFCAMGSFDMAKFVVESAERNLVYYTILIRYCCRRRQLEEAYALLREMRGLGFDPDVRVYNHLLGSFCKVDRVDDAHNLLQEMSDMGVSPDEITFEIFIYHSCRVGRMDFVSQFLDRLATTGLEPRLSTHAAIVKGYFSGEKFEDAYRYVHAVAEKHPPSSNMMYSLLASLYDKKGDVVIAHRILSEMMDKGLKPNYPICKKLIKHLRKSGHRDLADDLQRRFSSFRVPQLREPLNTG